MKPYIIPLAALLCLLLTACGTYAQAPAASIADTPTSLAEQSARDTPPTAAMTATIKTPGNIYLALGDSVTYGLGASLPGRTNFAGVFYSYLRQLPQTGRFINLALSGETSQTFIGDGGANTQLGRALGQIDAAKRTGLTIGAVTLLIGANDLLNTRGQSAPQRDSGLAAYERNLNTIVDRLSARLADAPSANIILMTYYNPYGGDANNTNNEATWTERLNAIVRATAQTRKLRLADIYPLFVGQPDALTWIAYNDVHPTDAGHALIAREVWRASGYDSIPPTLRIVFPANATTLKAGGTNSPRIALKVAATDNINLPLLSVRLLVDDKEVRVFDGVGGAYTTILDTSGLAPAAHTVRIVATDAANNTAEIALPLSLE